MREDIAQGIKFESDYQDARWGKTPHTVGEWLLIMRSEIDEAIEAWCDGRGDQGALEELLQATTVGIRCMEQHGVFHEQKHVDFIVIHG